jgi:hypothetical protein
MKTFKDSAGHEWTLAVTIDCVKRIRDMLKVDLLDLFGGEPPLLTRLDTDVVLLCDTIFVALKPQADAAGVSSEQFGAALGGDAIIAARDCFMEALSDFFQSLRRQEVVKAISKQTELVTAAVKLAGQRIENLDVPEMLSKAFGEPSTSLPASSASTPGP